MSEITERFAEIVGSRHLLTGDAIPDDYWPRRGVDARRRRSRRTSPNRPPQKRSPSC